MNDKPKLRNPGSSRPIDLEDPGTPITLLEHQWEGFTREVIPMAADEIQRSEMRRAFYAGAQGVLNAVNDAFRAGLPAEEVGKVLPAIHTEIDRYAQTIAARKDGTKH